MQDLFYLLIYLLSPSSKRMFQVGKVYTQSSYFENSLNA
jgi:hypothetical protein